jgi:hypothetical protein
MPNVINKVLLLHEYCLSKDKATHESKIVEGSKSTGNDSRAAQARNSSSRNSTSSLAFEQQVLSSKGNSKDEYTYDIPQIYYHKV